ncbi:SMI1/KNR4 family protein [Chryseobacterium vrystaatense]|uniref:SMI1 / KNR4 family (SUKH-1) n=1 Tax=Chryseobacterium vrystaatense TaxID=307480 RepID=A0A1M5KG11_9FLAO|nr:SMI1/KNR4 family protein [Chryseobacterium vrystaatense]SHG51113.1 SMI1 / KNR4 family (SUKH-1) [Chryseobacterium vrystaatense]
MMTIKEINNLDCSRSSFLLIKQESEKYWEQVDLQDCWGFQIQEGSRWKKGLSESELEDFQKQLNITFPEPLKNFYRTMNGLDKPGIDNNGGTEEIDFGPIFYSYPNDVPTIQLTIEWIMDANKVTAEIMNNQNVPSIFPYFGHRFLILDHEEIVLSMFGSDIIHWADNLSKGIAKDIFSLYSKIKTKKINTSSFWNRKIG